MKKYLLCFFFVLFACDIPLIPIVHAAGDAPPPPNYDWSFSGMFGTYDKASMQRGLKIYRQVCAGCHSLDRIYFRNLQALGYDENQIKALASEYTVEDGPNDEGEMFERPARPSDHFPGPYPNVKAAKAANNGAYPPDLSLITKARGNGPSYVRALLSGYEEAPHGKELMTGQYWNKYMAGHIIAMPPQFSDGLLSYEDGSPETVEQYSADIAHFLAWTAQPELENRKQTGLKVLIFLIIFSVLMYMYKKKIWSDVH